ncbi:MAG: hydroxylamine reductase [Nitrospinae bacterium]|nr:hydroxylamine reductase [Nitrospinota bacterium]
MKMFCDQCQETTRNEACLSVGICGKDEEVSDLQDLLVHVTKGIAYWADKAGSDPESDRFIAQALFFTITNVNFDADRHVEMIKAAVKVRDRLRGKAGAPAGNHPDAATVEIPAKYGRMLVLAEAVSPLTEKNEDIRSLKQLVTYGAKGAAAYAEHALVLGADGGAVMAGIRAALVATLDPNATVDSLLGATMALGNTCVAAMALLDGANTGRYGNPAITTVSTALKGGPAIVMSGHDLKDLEELLDQTAGTGVSVYTHSEMLPAHAYPFFKKYSHLAGHFGTAWHAQRQEFPNFHGVIIHNTNCIQEPTPAYQNRMYTTGLVGWPGVHHIANNADGSRDFSGAIDHAKALGDIGTRTGHDLTIGFAHNQVLALADKVVDAVKAGAIKKFVVMAGCDGRHPERNYFTDMAKALPNDAVILTAGCAKYRYNDLNLGDIGGIPRVLDAGQCNDCYSLAAIALALKDVFQLSDINDLPLDFAIGWYEQKAVCVLLALLALGVKGVRLGPTLPAFLSPNVVNVLVNTFDVKGITTVEQDLEAIMGTAATA